MNVRKFSELSSFDSLNLSPETVAILKSSGLSPAEVLLAFRSGEANFIPEPNYKEIKAKFTQSGFIRYDFDQISFNFGNLFRTIMPESANIFPVKVSDLNTHQKYEDYRPLSKDQVIAILEKLDGSLTPKEFSAVVTKFNLKQPADFEDQDFEVLADSDQNNSILINSAIAKLQSANKITILLALYSNLS